MGTFVANGAGNHAGNLAEDLAVGETFSGIDLRIRRVTVNRADGRVRSVRDERGTIST